MGHRAGTAKPAPTKNNSLLYGNVFADRTNSPCSSQMYLAPEKRVIPPYTRPWRSWLTPGAIATLQWGWCIMCECYRSLIRGGGVTLSAVQSGRIAAISWSSLFLSGNARAEIAAAGDDANDGSQKSAYGTSFPDNTKRVKGGAGCVFLQADPRPLMSHPPPAWASYILKPVLYEFHPPPQSKHKKNTRKDPTRF